LSIGVIARNLLLTFQLPQFFFMLPDLPWVFSAMT
jgi:hypothetical protein